MSGHASDKGALSGRLTLASCLREIERAQREVVGAMADFGHDDAGRFAVRAALEEALANAIEHGSGGDAALTVSVSFEVAEDAVVIEVADEGQGFDVAAVPDPTRPENMSIPSGRGLTLMRAFMSEVEFLPPGNRVRMVYRKRRSPEPRRHDA